MAVYTEVSDDALIDFIAQYDIGEVISCKGIAEGVENSNYLLKTTAGNYILTLYEKRVDPNDLPFFLGLMRHAAAKGTPCPQPINARNGEALHVLCGRPAAITSFLDGMWPRQIRRYHCDALGRALAKFHNAVSDFSIPRGNALSLSSWRPLYEKCESRAPEVRADLCTLLESELNYLEKNWPQDLPYGVCHADLFPDNVFFIGETLSGLIDFYFACNDALAYDIAVCMNAWCFERDGSFNATKARLLIAGYQEVRALTQAELDALPILARGSSIRFLLTRLYDWLNHPEGALVKPKDPLDYANILIFHQGVSSVASYGLDPTARFL